LHNDLSLGLKAPVRRARGKIEDAMDGDEEKHEDTSKDYELQILSKIKDMSDFGLTKIESTMENKSNSKFFKLNTKAYLSIYRTNSRKRRHTGQSRNGRFA
jgi:hypothetical protein